MFSTDKTTNTTGSTATSSTVMSSSTGMNLCGNGEVDAGESCDGTDLDAETCLTQGFLGGALACASDCTFDTTGCYNATCGDNVINLMEQCDGADLGGATCESEGFDAGTLACAASCMFDTSGCIDEDCFDTVDNDGDALADCADTVSCAQECEDACFAVPTILDPSTTAGDTTGHADDYASTCASSSGTEVVYQVVASATGFMHVTLTSDADLGISSWSDCPATGTQGACEDLDYGAGGVETISFPVTAGQVVHLMVEGYFDGGAGPFTLEVATVTAATCGDGFTDGTEACDDANAVNNDSCKNDCTLPVCGDGIVSSGEACDDGNITSGDGCESNCTISPCPTQPHAKCETGGALINAPWCTTNANQTVINAICVLDSYCCNNTWDDQCVDEVFGIAGSKQCTNSAGSCSHSLCATGSPLVAGCDASFGDCVTTICAQDSFCCNPAQNWDAQCVGEVTTYCGLTCN